MAFNNLQDTRTLWERCDLDTLSKAVLQVLINHRNSCSGLCNPGTTRIASETGMSTRSVKSRIALLTAQGVLKIVIKGTFTTPSGYAINLEGVATSECTPTGAGGSLVKDIHQTGAGDSLGVVQEAHEGSAGDAPKQISNKERNKEEPLPPPSPAAKREAQTHRFSLSEIPDAWKGYIEAVRPDLDPKKVFTDFRFYWENGRGSSTRRSDKGWTQSWQTWVRREKEAQRREGGQRRGEEFHPGDLDTTGFRDMFR